VAAFHCQQCTEKCLKAVIEEQDKQSLKSHDLFRLQGTANILLTETESKLPGIINEVYIDARYPGDMGLLPHGKPKAEEIETMIDFCESLFSRLKKQLSQ
jgi:HEPN domain-containing protein